MLLQLVTLLQVTTCTSIVLFFDVIRLVQKWDTASELAILRWRKINQVH